MNRSCNSGWFVTMCILALASDAMADRASCEPAAVLSGDPALVAEISAGLADRQIATTATAACPSVHVKVVRDEDFIVVDITDAANRTARRTVAKIGEAVSVIESWARPESADLMAGFTVEMPPASPPAPTPPAPPAVRATVEAEPRVVGRRRDILSIAATGSIAIDPSADAWIGGTLSACLPLGPLCAGATAHSRTATVTRSRSELAGLAFAELPIGIQRFVLSPGVGVGVGQALSNTMPGGQNQETTNVNLRAEARLTLSYPLARFVFLDVALAAEVSPFAEPAQDQNGSAPPAEPSVFVHLGAGLRIGAP